MFQIPNSLLTYNSCLIFRNHLSHLTHKVAFTHTQGSALDNANPQKNKKKVKVKHFMDGRRKGHVFKLARSSLVFLPRGTDGVPFSAN